MMGDFAQLPPVCDKPLYSKSELNNCQKKGALLFDLFTDVIIFNEIMRQQGQEENMFRNVLCKLSDGTFKIEHWKWLQSQK